MIPSWPSSLPQHFDRPGFDAGMGDGRVRSRTEAGPGKQREGFRAVADPVKGTMTMRGAQRAQCIGFVRETLRNGSLPFLFPDPHREGYDLLVTFDETMPRWSNPAGDLWTVELDLVSLPTGTWITGTPTLPPGGVYITWNGAYLIFNDALLSSVDAQ
ncbi:hypothetical protein [Methylobacterium sp. Leaf85]|uniref:hypothetical protein n=1 Tax=Methylobacterium sp. Leaf85 TaxID=1736241 RepID=UPI0007008477|nr:hypothetical protein [Methylobacterium sp. Leaf85]KQO53066.1 hypothetical protein ASF08_19265 [Methylobacterium sp. Leaf85]